MEVVDGFEDLSADASESVNADLDSHAGVPPGAVIAGITPSI